MKTYRDICANINEYNGDIRKVETQKLFDILMRIPYYKTRLVRVSNNVFQNLFSEENYIEKYIEHCGQTLPFIRITKKAGLHNWGKIVICSSPVTNHKIYTVELLCHGGKDSDIRIE